MDTFVNHQRTYLLRNNLKNQKMLRIGGYINIIIAKINFPKVS